MNLYQFVYIQVGIIAGQCFIFLAPLKAYKRAYKSYKTIKLKHFKFLFNDHYPIMEKQEKTDVKEVRLKSFIFQLVGYIINAAALIVSIICYCVGITQIGWLGLALILIDMFAGVLFIALA